jgi:hypothetical protein
MYKILSRKWGPLYFFDFENLPHWFLHLSLKLVLQVSPSLSSHPSNLEHLENFKTSIFGFSVKLKNSSDVHREELPSTPLMCIRGVPLNIVDSRVQKPFNMISPIGYPSEELFDCIIPGVFSDRPDETFVLSPPMHIKELPMKSFDVHQRTYYQLC